MKRRSFGLLAVISGFLLILSCNNGDPLEERKAYMKILEGISDQQWERVSEQKIYFGHQSVGFNIMDGIKDIRSEHEKIDLNIKETDNPHDFSSPVFAHSANGVNMDRQSKIDGFQKKVNEGLGNHLDIAFFKFCYVDITVHTDIDELFQNYKAVIDELEKKYTDVKFMHICAPLTGYPSSLNGFFDRIKQRIKPILGKKNTIYADNIRRHEFNNLLKQQYPQEHIFDLAKVESTKQSGQRESFKRNGQEYYLLTREYTHDGGHLNELGKKVVAQKMLLWLAELN